MNPRPVHLPKVKQGALSRPLQEGKTLLERPKERTAYPTGQPAKPERQGSGRPAPGPEGPPVGRTAVWADRAQEERQRACPPTPDEEGRPTGRAWERTTRSSPPLQ